jgi:hypothetical protein
MDFRMNDLRPVELLAMDDGRYLMLLQHALIPQRKLFISAAIIETYGFDTQPAYIKTLEKCPSVDAEPPIEKQKPIIEPKESIETKAAVQIEEVNEEETIDETGPFGDMKLIGKKVKIMYNNVKLGTGEIVTYDGRGDFIGHGLIGDVVLKDVEVVELEKLQQIPTKTYLEMKKVLKIFDYENNTDFYDIGGLWQSIEDAKDPNYVEVNEIP